MFRVEEPRRGRTSRVCGDAKVSIRARDGHGEVEDIRAQGKIQVGRGKARPRPSSYAQVPVCASQRLQELVEVNMSARGNRIHVARAGVVLGMVGRRNECEDLGIP